MSIKNTLEDPWDFDDPHFMALPVPSQGLITFLSSLLPSTMASKYSWNR